MIEYLRESSFIDDCVTHIATSAIMDLVYRVVIVPCDVEDVDAVKRVSLLFSHCNPHLPPI